MDKTKKAKRYERLHKQIKDLLDKSSNNPFSDMATICAVLHHKMDYFFWTGFYLMDNGDMTVNMYQGPVACQILEKDKGVCWAAYTKKETIVVEDVHDFPGHIACDSRSNSEIVVPLKNTSGNVIGVLDVDSSQKASFSEVDARWLEKILELVWI